MNSTNVLEALMKPLLRQSSMHSLGKKNHDSFSKLGIYDTAWFAVVRENSSRENVILCLLMNSLEGTSNGPLRSRYYGNPMLIATTKFEFVSIFEQRGPLEMTVA